MSDADRELENIFVDLPNHWATGGESLWAFRLDDGTYQIDNVPFYAYGVNYRDIVRVDSSTPDQKPIVKEVVKPSGHRTIRVIFPKEVGKAEQAPIISVLEKMHVSAERAFEYYLALDIPPIVDYDSVRDTLDGYQHNGILEYETCEPRADGHFDEGPADSDEVASVYEN
jgi:hypothetical protein